MFLRGDEIASNMEFPVPIRHMAGDQGDRCVYSRIDQICTTLECYTVQHAVRCIEGRCAHVYIQNQPMPSDDCVFKLYYRSSRPRASTGGEPTRIRIVSRVDEDEEVNSMLEKDRLHRGCSLSCRVRRGRGERHQRWR